jgi:signal transduction histidine kinase/putative methionine-R-sulfoxide reductase with GAF domain
VRTELDAGAAKLSGLIRERQAEILDAWERRARAEAVAAELSQPALRDHLPDLLARLAAAVEAGRTGAEVSLEGFPEAHALHRLDLGYDLGTLVNEYTLLRSTILRTYRARSSGPPDLHDVERLDAGLDEAIRLSVAKYATARGRTLVALDRFAQAALGSDDMAALLPQLLAVVVDTVDAVDMAALFLFDGDRLHVAASVGMLEAFPKLELAIGEGFAGLVAAERRPLELRDAGRSPLVKLRALPRDTKALYGVPLEDQERLIGVTYMGSRTANEFAREDTILLRAMASRATAFIVHARLRRAERDARARADGEHRLLEAVLRQLPVGVALAEAPSGRVIMSNASLERLLGPAAPAPSGAGAAAEAGLTRGLHVGPAVAPLARAVTSGEATEGEEIIVERGDGSRAVTIQSAVPVRDGQGRVVGGVVAVVDITERKALEERLRATAEFRESFIGILSHDLRNLVATIGGTAHVLLAGGGLDPRTSELVARIGRTSERMGRMIRDLLDFTRGRLGGGMPIAPQPVDLAEICGQVADEFRAAHPDREIRLEVEGDVTGRWDPDRLAQALTNLCKNAIDYGAPRAPVEVRAAGQDRSVELTVANTGPPIPADVLPTLFDPYRRASSREHRTGLGLGLFIVREIARAHGGTIEPRSLDGRVEFSLRLPRLP